MNIILIVSISCIIVGILFIFIAQFSFNGNIALSQPDVVKKENRIFNRIENAADNVIDSVKKNPVKSILISALIIWLLKKIYSLIESKNIITIK